MRRTPHSVSVFGIPLTILALATGGWLSTDECPAEHPTGHEIHMMQAIEVDPAPAEPANETVMVHAVGSVLDC